MENCEKVFSKYVLTDDKLKKLMKKKDFLKFIDLKHSLKDMNFDEIATAFNDKDIKQM